MATTASVSGIPSESQWLAAIRQQETGSASNPDYTHDSAGCMGAYCWAAQGDWSSMATEAGYGQYANTPPYDVPGSVQDAVAWAMMGPYVEQGELSQAAELWNGGVPYAVPNPVLGSSATYASEVISKLQAIMGGTLPYNAGSSSSSAVLTSASGAPAGAGVTSAIESLLAYPLEMLAGLVLIALGLYLMYGDLTRGGVGGAVARVSRSASRSVSRRREQTRSETRQAERAREREEYARRRSEEREEHAQAREAERRYRQASGGTRRVAPTARDRTDISDIPYGAGFPSEHRSTEHRRRSRSHLTIGKALESLP